MRVGAGSLIKGLFRAAAALAAACLAPVGASAATLTTLYNFCSQTGCADGKTPAAGLIRDTRGNLYGTTVAGGAGREKGGGTVFRLAPEGTLTVLHSFPSSAQISRDGAAPEAPLVSDPAGGLYGTTLVGGDTPYLAGAGVAFALPSNGTEGRLLYEFCSKAGCADGWAPLGLVRDRGGDLYGATAGAEPDITGGVVFRLAHDASSGEAPYEALYAFPYPLHPSAGLVIGRSDTLYGTVGNTAPLGPTYGFVFALTPNRAKTIWMPQTLYSFCSRSLCTDGFDPQDLISDRSGTLYGTTAMGGEARYGQGGTLFSLTPDVTKTRWRHTRLYSFCAKPACADGAAPTGLVIDAAGNLYGTAGAGPDAGGVVFRLAPDRTYTVLHSFCSEAGCADGSAPYGPLILDEWGNLYGVTGGGGAYGGGTVFELTP